MNTELVTRLEKTSLNFDGKRLNEILNEARQIVFKQ